MYQKHSANKVWLWLKQLLTTREVCTIINKHKLPWVDSKYDLLTFSFNKPIFFSTVTKDGWATITFDEFIQDKVLWKFFFRLAFVLQFQPEYFDRKSIPRKAEAAPIISKGSFTKIWSNSKNTKNWLDVCWQNGLYSNIMLINVTAMISVMNCECTRIILKHVCCWFQQNMRQTADWYQLQLTKMTEKHRCEKPSLVLTKL